MLEALATFGSGLFFTTWSNVAIASLVWLISQAHPALSAAAILVLVSLALADEGIAKS
jgi:hypothetical protein